MTNIDFNDISVTLIRWIKLTANDIDVIWEMPNLPAPKLPYISLSKTTSLLKHGSDALTFKSGTLWNSGGQRSFTLSIKAYGREYFEAENIIFGILISMEYPSVLELLRSAGLSIWTVSPVQNISTELEDGFEYRAMIDVTFGISSNVEIDLSSIDKVIAESNLESLNKENINIPN